MAPKVKYLFTTPQGEQIEVELSQAGESLTTASGEVVELPTFRELKQLPQVIHEDETGAKMYWNPMMGVLFGAGLIIFGICVLSAIFYLVFMPDEVEKPIVLTDAISKSIDQMNVEDLLSYWDSVQQPYAVASFRTGNEIHHQIAYTRVVLDQRIKILSVVAAIGLALMIIPIGVGLSKRK